jgi:two-component system sensor histidine kinase HydH
MTKRLIRLDQNEILAAVGTATLKIAHEIGNSLTIMSTSVQVIESVFQEQRAGVDDWALSTLRDMTAEVERMKELLEELRNISRPAKVTIVPLNLHEIVTGFVRNGRVAAWPHNIEVEHHIPDDLPPVLADREKLARALHNLCVNAFDAMPNGGKLALRAYKAAERVCLEIQDTGVGIPEGFDPFRPFNTTKEKGWGLGLAVVTQIVQALNGTLAYESQRGEGTTFLMCLPAGRDGGSGHPGR